MPEGPEVKTSAECLEEKLHGMDLIDVTMNDRAKGPYVRGGGFPGMDKLKKVCLRNIGFTKRGKKVIMYSRNQNQSHIRIIFGYGMDGRLIYEESKHSGFCFQFGRVIPQDNGVDLIIVDFELWFHDGRHMGLINATFSEEEYNFVMKHVGPDLMEGEVSYDLFKSIVTRKTRRNMRLAEFVMEQKYMSGVGNYVRAECLYRARLSPHRTLGSFSEEDLVVLYNSIINTLRESYESGGLTLRTYISPDNRIGTFKKVIYDNEFDPYGNTIQKFEDKKKRMVHWVPGIQI
jgi:formamidopyrimidine-DNA glycosylase